MILLWCSFFLAGSLRLGSAHPTNSVEDTQSVCGFFSHGCLTISDFHNPEQPNYMEIAEIKTCKQQRFGGSFLCFVTLKQPGETICLGTMLVSADGHGAQLLPTPLLTIGTSLFSDSQRSHLSSFTMKLKDKFHSPKIKRTPSKKGKPAEVSVKVPEKPVNKVSGLSLGVCPGLRLLRAVGVCAVFKFTPWGSASTAEHGFRSIPVLPGRGLECPCEM